MDPVSLCHWHIWFSSLIHFEDETQDLFLRAIIVRTCEAATSWGFIFYKFVSLLGNRGNITPVLTLSHPPVWFAIFSAKKEAAFASSACNSVCICMQLGYIFVYLFIYVFIALENCLPFLCALHSESISLFLLEGVLSPLTLFFASRWSPFC